MHWRDSYVKGKGYEILPYTSRTSEKELWMKMKEERKKMDKGAVNMNKDLSQIIGKKIANVLPVLSEISNDVVKLQFIFTDDSEILIDKDETTLDWIIK